MYGGFCIYGDASVADILLRGVGATAHDCELAVAIASNRKVDSAAPQVPQVDHRLSPRTDLVALGCMLSWKIALPKGSGPCWFGMVGCVLSVRQGPVISLSR
jgi:hypothetical protein